MSGQRRLLQSLVCRLLVAQKLAGQVMEISLQQQALRYLMDLAL
jgi:hypothetical protein